MTRVLVVEDEESYREALSYMLSKEGFEVIEAHDGATGIAEFDRRGRGYRPARPDDAGPPRNGSVPTAPSPGSRPGHHAHCAG